MEEVKQLLKVTNDLQQHLQIELPKKDREAYITKINTLLEERQHILDKITSANLRLDPNDKIIKAVLQLNEQIEKLLGENIQYIKKDINQLQHSKKKNKKYSNPYENVSGDGMFLDKKS